MDKLPKGWSITGWGPEGEGVEATGPNGSKVVTAFDSELSKAIRELTKSNKTD